MHIKYVIDSSSLISLAKINCLDFLEEMKPLHCPTGVFEETVGEGIRTGYLQSIQIEKLFQQGIIRAEKIEGKKRPGISATDSDVITLAHRRNVIILSNDTNLCRLARLEGAITWGTADVCAWKKKNGKISQEAFLELIGTLVKKGRLSEKNARIYRGEV